MLLASCSNSLYDSLPARDAAYKVIPVQVSAQDRASYLLGAGDELSLTVVSEPDLSVGKLVIDDSGNIQVPLIGEMNVLGLSAGAASRMIEQAYGRKYLRNPQVALNLTAPAQRMLSVEGQVTKAGVFPMTPDMTLLSAIAMAESTSKNARLDEVVVFRTRNDEHLVARFDLERIRAGLDPDPQMLPGDRVVVGFSHAKAIYHDFLTTAPFFNIFTRF